MAMKQREAVYKVTTEALAARSIDFTPGETDVKEVATADIRSEITRKLVHLFQDGAVDLKSTESNQTKLSDENKLRSYVAGLITNWFNKDPNLNGGSKHKAKNPGSRVADDQLREMRLLKKRLEIKGDASAIARVDQAINDRVQELKAAKQPSVPAPDVDSLPEFLRDLAV